MAGVMIGIDPHKGSHTAFAAGRDRERLGEVRVRASSEQVDALRSWAQRWPERTLGDRGQSAAWVICSLNS